MPNQIAGIVGHKILRELIKAKFAICTQEQKNAETDCGKVVLI